MDFLKLIGRPIGLLVSLSLLILLANACNGLIDEEKIEISHSLSSKEISVSDNGWLVVPNKDVLSQIVRELSTQQEALEKYDRDKAYTSFFNAWRELGESDYEVIASRFHSGQGIGEYEHLILIDAGPGRELEEKLQVTHPILQWLANEKGLIQIGDSLKKYTYEWVISVPVANDSLIKEVQENADYSTDAWQKFRTPITRTSISERVIDSRAGNNRDTREYKPGNLNMRRVLGLLEWHDDGINQVVSSETKHQRRISGIWFGDNAPELIHRNSGYLIWGDQDTTQIDIDVTLFDEKSTPAYALGVCASFCLRTDIDIIGVHKCGDCDGNATYDNQTATTTYVMPWP